MIAKNRSLKVVMGAVLAGVLAGGIFYFSRRTEGPIIPFVDDRDTQEVLKIFKDDWYWLFPEGDYDPAYILKYRVPGKQLYQARYKGKLNISVARDSDRVAGFTTYYKKNFYEGRVQFVAVSHDFRRRGYGRLLTEYAIEQLINMGSQKIVLTTRVNNFGAQRIYERIGFKKTDDDGEFFFYALDPKDFKKEAVLREKSD